MVNQDQLKEQIYGSKKQLRRALKLIETDERIIPENRKTLLEFAEHEKNRGLSPTRIIMMLINMKRVARLMDKSFGELTKEDLKIVLGKIINDTNLSEWTKDMNKAFLKMFYRWFHKVERGDSDPDIVRWIVRTRPPSHIRTEDLLTIDEIKQIYSACNNVMLRALVSVLYEGAPRPGELLRMQVQDVVFNKEYVKINVRGKMERKQGDRTIYLFNSYDPLKEWLEEHPTAKLDKTAPVWINGKDVIHKGELTREACGPLPLYMLTKLLRRMTKAAGLKKNVYPYLFRHSRGTELYKQIGEAMAKKYMGHSPDSKMARVYLHLNDRDILDSMLQNYGLREEVKKDDRNICKACGHPNSYVSEVCSVCRSPLKDPDVAKAIHFEDKIVTSKEYKQMLNMKELLENPNVLKVLREAAKQ